MPIVSVAGVMGAGKTSVLRALQKRGYDATLEPVERWSEWLTAFYQSRTRHAFGFQTRILWDQYQTWKTMRPEQMYLVERSPEESMEIFGRALRGDMAPFEWDLYQEQYDALAWKPDLILYLHVPADVAWQRVCQRARPTEHRLGFPYLCHLNTMYESYFTRHPRAVVIDATRPLEEVVASVQDELTTHGWGLDAERAQVSSLDLV